MTKGEQAAQLFRQGANCCQAVVGAFEENAEDIMRLASSFGGGIGRLGEVCGAVSGMCMVAGLHRGYAPHPTATEKQAHYALIQKLAQQFQEKNGSIVCRELLAGVSPQDAHNAEKCQKKPCVQLVEEAANIVASLLETK